MLSVTKDMRHTRADQVDHAVTLVWDFPIWAGQSQRFAFRIVNDSEPVTVTIQATGEHPERLSFSHREKTDYRGTLTLLARSGGMTDTVWIEISVPDDASTEVVTTTIRANDEIFVLEYNAFGSWDERTDPYPRYAG